MQRGMKRDRMAGYACDRDWHSNPRNEFKNSLFVCHCTMNHIDSATNRMTPYIYALVSWLKETNVKQAANASTRSRVNRDKLKAFTLNLIIQTIHRSHTRHATASDGTVGSCPATQPANPATRPDAVPRVAGAIG